MTKMKKDVYGCNKIVRLGHILNELNRIDSDGSWNQIGIYRSKKPVHVPIAKLIKSPSYIDEN